MLEINADQLRGVSHTLQSAVVTCQSSHYTNRFSCPHAGGHPLFAQLQH